MADEKNKTDRKDRFTDSDSDSDRSSVEVVERSVTTVGSSNRNGNTGSSQPDDVYTVEKIVGKRKNPETNVTEYRIKWVNYPSSDNTWEPKKNIYCVEMIADYEKEVQERELKRKRKEEEREKLRLQKKKEMKEKSTKTARDFKVKKEKKKKVEEIQYEDTSDSDEENPQPKIPGFDLGYHVERIIGASRKDYPLQYLIKFKERACPELVLNTVCHEKCPAELIQYLSKKCQWTDE